MAVTSTVGKVTIGYSGPELVVTPAGTGNSNVDSSPAPVTGLYNPYDPTQLLQNLPVTTGYLPPPTGVSVAVNSGSGTTTTYEVVATLGTQDGVPSGTATVSGAATPNNTVSWAYVPGASGYKVIRTVGGATQGLIATISNPFTTSYTDANATGSAYTPSTSNPLASLAVRPVDINGAAIGSTSGMLNTSPAALDPAQDGVYTRRQTDVSVAGLTTVTGQTTSYASADWDTSKISCLAVDFNCTALTVAGATFAVLLERKGADGLYYIISSTTITVVGQKVIDIGPGSLVTVANTMRLVVLFTGGTTPSMSFTFAAHGY